MPPEPAYTSTVNPKRTFYSLVPDGLAIRQRGLFGAKRGLIPYREIVPEYTVTHSDDSRHEQAMLIVIVILLVAVALVAGLIFKWKIMEHIQREHWYGAICIAGLGLLIAAWLALRHRGPEIRYHFSGTYPFVIGGSLETKEDLDIFVNLLQQRIWSGS